MCYLMTGLVTGMDNVVGTLVNKLESKGLMDNTYIIFVSDVSPGTDGLLLWNYKGDVTSTIEGTHNLLLVP